MGEAREEAHSSSALSRRFAASVLDWILLFFAAGIGPPLLADVVTGRELSGVTLLLEAGLVVLVYFTLQWAWSGRTLGMRIVGIRLLAARNGRPPGPLRALARSLAALVAGASALVLVVFAVSDTPPDGRALTDTIALVGAATVATAVVLGHLMQLRDPKGRSVQDRLFGLVVTSAARNAASEPRA